MSSAKKIDESLYSRQMYVYGKSMQQISNAVVLLINLTELTVEVAKNIILSGVKQVDIVDDSVINENQYGTNIYISESDVGKKTTDVLLPKLRELNPYVTVNVISSTEINLRNYDTVVMLDAIQSEQIHINKETRKLDIPFISGTTYGLTGCVFNDFGDHFVVTDPTGENIQEGTISNAYIREDEWFVDCDDIQDLTSGNLVNLHNTQSEEVMGPYKIKDIQRTPQTNIVKLCVVEDDDIVDLEGVNKETNFLPNKFTSYGELKEVRKPVSMKFNELEKALDEPTHSYIFYEQMNRQDMLHVIYQLESIFEKKNKRFPCKNNDADFQDFMSGLKEVKTEVELDEDFVKKFINHSGLVPGVISVIGSLVSQEVLKAVTGKYTPINQFIYFESFDSLPDSPHDIKLSKDVTKRYGQMVNVFGLEFMEKLLNLKMFMVGCGAIGCELLKNFAMMGVASGPNGQLVVTDPDTIERSNLNRQFLFRTRHIGQFKAEAATEAVNQMNPDMKMRAERDKVCPDSEDVYNTQFWSDLDVVANALDNLAARRYVDGKCVENKRPLLESGTLGVKGNVQVVVPNKSESYASSSDPPEKDIPVCTLKNFPSQIEHTAQWALAIFKAHFEDAPNNINRYLETPEFIADLEFDELQNVYKDIVRYGIEDVPTSTVDSVIVAVKQFTYYFDDMIAELLNQFPADHKTTSGLPFWSGNKRCPKAIPFDANNQIHLEFIQHFVFLYNRMYGVNDTTDITSDYLTEVLRNHGPIDRYPIKEKFAANDEEEKALAEERKNSTDERGDIIKSLNPAVMKPKMKVTQLVVDKFEKDDDSNHHIDLISTVANTRATNYEINNADRHKIKGIVGRIIPAVATTTSLVAGLVSLELCKFVAGHTDLDKFRNAFINLGISFTAFSDPTKASVQKLGDKEFTMWDHLDIKGDMRLIDLREYIQKFYNTEVDSINYGKKCVYNGLIPGHLNDARDNLLMSELFKTLEVDVIPGNCMTLSIMLDTDEDFEEPDVRYFL